MLDLIVSCRRSERVHRGNHGFQVVERITVIIVVVVSGLGNVELGWIGKVYPLTTVSTAVHTDVAAFRLSEIAVAIGVSATDVLNENSEKNDRYLSSQLARFRYFRTDHLPT